MLSQLNDEVKAAVSVVEVDDGTKSNKIVEPRRDPVETPPPRQHIGEQWECDIEVVERIGLWYRGFWSEVAGFVSGWKRIL